MAIEIYEGDLPADISLGDSVAIDTETMGLVPGRDRLCLVQLSAGDSNAHLVRFRPGQFEAPNLTALLASAEITKIFHYARFDVAVLRRYLGVTCRPIYCTKIASKLCRTYTDKHGLKDLCRELLGVELDKASQTSDWGAEDLTRDQLSYAASDVLHLHVLREKLDAMLAREARSELAAAAFQFLPARAVLDLAGWSDIDIFAH